MNWIARVPADRRRRVAAPAMIEVLEARALLADGITPAAGAPLNGTVGVALTNVVVATFTVTDPSVNGSTFRARVNWGDNTGSFDKNIPATPLSNGSFEFLDSHTYAKPGTYTITVNIAVPGSSPGGPTSGTGGQDNMVQTTATITGQPTPALPSSIGPFQSAGLTARAKVNRTFHGSIARFSDPHTKPQQFSATIDWGDQSGPTRGQIRRQGSGKYLVVGAHRYGTPGAFAVTVTIQNTAGQEIAAKTSLQVGGK
jgi:hypothetical protein